MFSKLYKTINNFENFFHYDPSRERTFIHFKYFVTNVFAVLVTPNEGDLKTNNIRN